MAICLCPQIYGHRMPIGKPLDEKRGRPVRKPAEVAKCWPQLTHDNIISWGENKVLIYGCDTSGHVPRFWSNQPLIPLNQHISHWYIPIISSYTYCPHTGRLPTLPLWERQGAESRDHSLRSKLPFSDLDEIWSKGSLVVIAAVERSQKGKWLPGYPAW